MNFGDTGFYVMSVLVVAVSLVVIVDKFKKR
jgi:hypothetical protein